MRVSLAAGLVAAVAFTVPVLAQTTPDEFKLMMSEKIGALRIEMTQAELKQALPAKPALGKEQLWGADGQYHQKWSYAAQGLRVGMVSEKKGAAKKVESIECSARCTLKTARGIGIGSTLDEVQKAYAAEFNKEESKLPGTFVAGTIYGGLIFTFKAGKVSVLYLGAAAE